MEIKVLRINKDLELPNIIDKGDWIDLCTSEDTTLKCPRIEKLKKYRKDDHTVRIREVAFDSALIPLGMAMELPEGFEAILVPRSSTFKKYSIMQTNSFGVIDNSYSSNEDEWKMPVIALNNTTIPKGERICQFRIQLSQKASVWQKIKWLFSNKIKIVEVDHLDNEARGGFGSTDNK